MGPARHHAGPTWGSPATASRPLAISGRPRGPARSTARARPSRPGSSTCIRIRTSLVCCIHRAPARSFRASPPRSSATAATPWGPSDRAVGRRWSTGSSRAVWVRAARSRRLELADRTRVHGGARAPGHGHEQGGADRQGVCGRRSWAHVRSALRSRSWDGCDGCCARDSRPVPSACPPGSSTVPGASPRRTRSSRSRASWATSGQSTCHTCGTRPTGSPKLWRSCSRSAGRAASASTSLITTSSAGETAAGSPPRSGGSRRPCAAGLDVTLDFLHFHRTTTASPGRRSWTLSSWVRCRSMRCASAWRKVISGSKSAGPSPPAGYATSS